MRFLLELFSFLGFNLFLLALPAQPQNPLLRSLSMVSVCDILREPKRYDGQFVSIHAFLGPSFDNTSFDELGPLPSESCYRVRRRSSLRIGIGAGLPNPPDGFDIDIDSYDIAGKTLNDILENDPETKTVRVNVEGIIYDGGPEPSGFTRHPWYPVRMLISRWKEIRKP